MLTPHATAAAKPLLPDGPKSGAPDQTSTPTDAIKPSPVKTPPVGGTRVPHPSTDTTIAIDDIKEMPAYTRDLRDDHVQVLLASIAAHGLEQPVVLYGDNMLVAGRHRYRALLALRDKDPGLFERIFPGGLIRAVAFDLGPEPDPIDVLALEVNENTARQDFSDDEVAKVVKVLLGRGFTNKRGKPGPNDRPIGPELMRVFGMSERTMRRVVRVATHGTREKPKPTGAGTAQADGAKAAEQTPQAESNHFTAAKLAVRALNDEQFAEFAEWLAQEKAKRAAVSSGDGLDA